MKKEEKNVVDTSLYSRNCIDFLFSYMSPIIGCVLHLVSRFFNSRQVDNTFVLRFMSHSVNPT